MATPVYAPNAYQARTINPTTLPHAGSAASPAAAILQSPAVTGIARPNYSINGVTYNSNGDVVPNPAPPTVPTSVAPTVAPPVYAPKFDTAAVAAQARADAANAVNPYYTQELSKFLSQQGNLQSQEQAKTATDVQNAKDTLAEALKSNDLTGTRTTEDTGIKEGQINQTQDQYQQDSGDQFETARLAQARAQAQAGVLGSGTGNGQTNTAIITRNTTEGRAVDQAQQQKDAAELFKARTFEDLANSNTLANTTEGKSEAQSNFDLSNYITNLNYQTDSQRDALDKARQDDIATQTTALAKTAYNNYINGIANPATRQVAAQTYGSSF